jgi:hypothetical protein
MGAVLLSLFVLGHHAAARTMLMDTDTKVLLQNIQTRHAPFSWFLSDWPLYNHFYRPIPTLLFELDLRLYNYNAAGYGWTNAILCAASVLSLFWLVRELFDQPILALVATLLFTLWQTDTGYRLIDWLTWIALAVFVIGAIRHRKSWRAYVTATLSILFLQKLLIPFQPLASRTLDWLPGRTATSMTVFALLAMASYARYERLRGPQNKPAAPTPHDPPATKSAKVAQAQTKPLLAVAACILTALTLATYEQAVMLPACLLGLAVFFALSGYKPNWRLQAPFWGLLGAYLVLRHQVIPPGTSSYQAQQLRTSLSGTSMSLFGVAFPPLNELSPFFASLQEERFYALLNNGFYAQLFSWTVVFAGIYQLRKEWKLALTGWALGVISFLPMAFLKFFEHYYYWPMALWTILVTTAALVACRLTVIALSPPALQTPPRSDPAPGSLVAP